MLQNAYFLAKIGADTAENEQHFAEILPKTDNYHTACPFPAPLPSVRAVCAGLEVLDELHGSEGVEAGPD